MTVTLAQAIGRSSFGSSGGKLSSMTRPALAPGAWGACALPLDPVSARRPITRSAGLRRASTSPPPSALLLHATVARPDRSPTRPTRTTARSGGRDGDLPHEVGEGLALEQALEA